MLARLPVVTIEPAEWGDIAVVAALMRDEDWREISAQWPAGTRRMDVALAAHKCPLTLAARRRGHPHAVFGAQPLAASVLGVWCFGTTRMWRVVPALTRYIMDVLRPQWIARGITRVEARSIADHATAHRWMARMGGVAVPCPGQGRGGEDFLLFSWTAQWR